MITAKPTTWSDALKLADEKARAKDQPYIVACRGAAPPGSCFHVLTQSQWESLKRKSERGTEIRITRAVRVSPVTLPHRRFW